jgi:protein phosphatase
MPSSEAPTQALVQETLKPKTPITSATKDKTQLLSAGPVGFSLLPVGAMVGAERQTYIVLEGQVDRPNSRHSYRVERTDDLVVRCPSCGHLADQKEPYCPSCGTDLSDVKPALRRYLLREFNDERLITRERALIGRKLPQDGLLVPIDSFNQPFWTGIQRHYLVYPEKPAVDLELASSLAVPQPLEEVLKWGIAACQGLHHLHSHQIAHGQITPSSILVGDEDALLTDFASAVSLKAKPKEAAELIHNDIVALATSLMVLLGAPETVAPPDVLQILEKAQGRIPDQSFASVQAFGQALRQALNSLAPVDLKIHVGHRTAVGMIRDHNEDNEVVKEKGLLSSQIPMSYGIYVVADGMGGHAAGEVASDLAAETALSQANQEARSLTKPNLKHMEGIVARACQAANQAVYDERHKRESDMGTTIVAALRIGDQVTIGNIGDSRAYLINARAIKQITVDHSLVQRLLDTGQISEAEARVHPQRNLIYRVVGDKKSIEPDTFSLRLRPGDQLLLCSDGLSGMVPDDVIWQTTLSFQDPQAACNRLIELANQAGGEDNITVIIVQATRPA